MPKILIADDNTNIQRMVALAFEERGIQVVSVGNGEAAVRRLADLNPDLVLADIFMPVRSGYEVCEYIKKDQRFSHVPVILLIGAFDPLDEKEARRVGADGVLKKPFVPPDPLIAMVTSVLERNPRVAAELAKAKDKEVMVEPEPLPEPVSVAKVEPKPLPEFPEPTTPEEAALAYGFGSGRRSVLEEAKDREEEAIEATDVEDDEEFSVGETSHDWRRAAMDFEVPAEAGGRPAFTDEVAFPSESQVPPQHLRVNDAELENAAAEAPVKHIEPVADSSPFEFAPEPAKAAEVTAVAEPEVVEAAAAVAPSESAWSTVEESPVAAQEPEAIVAQHDVKSEPVFAASSDMGGSGDLGAAEHVPHWMDALSAEPSTAGWMSGLPGDHREQNEVFAPLALRDQPGPLVAIAPDLRMDVAHQTLVAEISSGTGPEASASPAGDHASSFAETANDSWFAPAPAAFDALPEAEPAHAAEAPHDNPEEHGHRDEHRAQHRDEYDLMEAAAVRVTPEPLLQTDDPYLITSVPSRDLELFESPAVRVTPEPLLQTDEADVASPVALRDPALEQSPAVFVTPEPLLDSPPVDDAESQPEVEAHADGHSEPAPQDSVFVPLAFQHAASEHPSSEHVEPAPVTGHWHAEPAASSAESDAEEFSERIPTAPPPNRQALAEIPFLTPPPEFFTQSHGTHEEAAISAETVDAVAQRVVERLAPQLQELLSQGVLKPLIENMLHEELARKNR